MILISHRGNIGGKVPNSENHPLYIDNTIKLGYDVEVDVWMVGSDLLFGHDEPQYNVDIKWIKNRSNKLWIHCKNLESIRFFNILDCDVNYFWHETDTVTLTSKKYIWAYPSEQPVVGSIAVMPELNNITIEGCIGVCSDFIENYKHKI